MRDRYQVCDKRKSEDERRKEGGTGTRVCVRICAWEGRKGEITKDLGEETCGNVVNETRHEYAAHGK